MIEIERKFLLKNTLFLKEIQNKQFIKQGYLNSHKERTVRIRITNTDAFITIKGVSSESGLSRFEWEKNISRQEADALFQLAEQGVIEKNRYTVFFGNCKIEIDEFLGENKGLFLAEIELKSENEVVALPEWIGEEVTGNVKYYNSYLSKNPYIYW